MFIPGHRQAAADVYNAGEIAKAAGVTVRLVRDRMAGGLISSLDGTFVAETDAVAAVRELSLAPASAAGSIRIAPPELLAPPAPARRRTGLPLALSGSLHAAAILFLVVASSLGILGSDTESDLAKPLEPARLVFLVKAGPGGGGGGGGTRQKTAPKLQMKRPAPSPASRPIPIRRPPPVTTRARVEMPPPQPAVRPVMRDTTPIQLPRPAPAAPAVVAPVVSAPADAQDKAGTLDSTSNGAPSSGAGSGGGAGTGSGSGTGMGEGDGAGIGPGSGGGTGGGPYRPGSGIEPPSLLREVKPSYTDEARRQGVEGDVVLEIVVRRDGTVGDVKIMRRLGAGLDQKAIDAVRQWRFAPARRMGAPVDVIVDVSVEFKLR